MPARRARPAGDETRRMADEVREGLTARPAWLPCKYFYDDRGSALFDEITRLPEYYQTRTEERILEGIAEDVVARVGPLELLELGSGMGRKIRLILDAMSRQRRLGRCILFDVNERCLDESGASLAAAYPGLVVEGIVGDFTRDLAAIDPPAGRRLALFFAGTIGNLHPDEVPGFVSALGARLAPGDAFLVGVDLVKDPAWLHAAYNDAAGVTALFNLNILRVVNERLGADFDSSAFEHVAFYDAERAWIEMRVRATRASRVRIPASDLDLRYETGDEIRTEISCKYTRPSFEARLAGSGLAMSDWSTDAEGLFALALLVRTG